MESIGQHGGFSPLKGDMAQRTFYATFMGALSAEALAGNVHGTVLGMTSKGIFLRCGDSILFITEAPYKSPFNIYIPGFERLMNSLEINSRFEVTPTAIVFPTEFIQIVTENAEIWIPEPPVKVQTTKQRRLDLMDSLLKTISELDETKGWIFLYNYKHTLPAEISERIIVNTQGFCTGYQQGDLEICLAAAERLLGLGGGLTPSGDDWITGFLLYQTRFLMASGDHSKFLEQLVDALQKMAFQKTTTISANRILAAGRGWAEEPFLQVIDTLFSGDEMPAGLAVLLTLFGHSSGVDTTLGISSSIKCE